MCDECVYLTAPKQCSLCLAKVSKKSSTPNYALASLWKRELGKDGSRDSDLAVADSVCLREIEHLKARVEFWGRDRRRLQDDYVSKAASLLKSHFSENGQQR